MNRPLFSHRLTVMLTAFFTLAFTASIASAQSAGQLESELSSLSGQMSSAESNESAADQVIGRLDAAEASFAKLTSSGKVDKGALIPVYHQLEGMLDRMQTAWSKKKDDCINTIDNGRLDWFTPGPSRHPVFGKITSGMDIVKKIETTPTGSGDRPKTPVKMIKVTVKE